MGTVGREGRGTSGAWGLCWGHLGRGTSGTWDVRDVGRQGRGRGTWGRGTSGTWTWDVDGLTRPAVYNGGKTRFI